MSDYIHPELIPNIVARLPVDDVIRCTSVCKSWYSIITCPSFVSSHLNLSSSNQERRLLIRYCKSENNRFRYCLYRDNESFDEVAELDSPSTNKLEVIGCVNGLLCFSSGFDDTIMLWNPSLRKSFLLPKPRVLSSILPCDDRFKQSVGFGFTTTSNELKIVRFARSFSTMKLTAEIYQLSTGSWRDLKIDYRFGIGIGIPGQLIHLNGILHWFSRIGDEAFIYSFDLESERFHHLAIPSSVVGANNGGLIKLYTFKDSLCLICLTVEGKVCDIWFMKEYDKSDSWERLCSVQIKQHRLADYLTSRHYPTFRHNGDILFGAFYTENCKGKGKGKIELVSYDYQFKQVKNLGVLSHHPYEGPVFSAHPYVESLLLMKTPNDEESTDI